MDDDTLMASLSWIWDSPEAEFVEILGAIILEGAEADRAGAACETVSALPRVLAEA